MSWRATGSILLLLVAREAAASGSSHVEATSGAVRITADTPSIAFADEGDEQAFHSEWRVDAQPVVDRAIVFAVAEVARWKRKERRLLTPWSPDLRVAQSWAEPSEPTSLEAEPGPVCYTAPIGLPDSPSMTIPMVYLCFASAPDRAVADRLVRRLAAAVAVPAPEPDAAPE